MASRTWDAMCLGMMLSRRFSWKIQVKKLTVRGLLNGKVLKHKKTEASNQILRSLYSAAIKKA